MALHGQIMVNQRPIGFWSAVRDPDFTKPKVDDVVPYFCELVMDQTLEGFPAIKWEGIVKHRFGDGALALASLVLSEAQKDTKSQKKRRV